MRNAIIGTAIVAVFCTALPEDAVAQKYVPRSVKRQARKLLRKGRYAYKKKRFKQAVKYFLEAFKVWPRRELNYNIAIAYGRLGEKIKAVTYLRAFEKDASAKELRSIPKWLRELKDEVAVINIQGPNGATVKMDGKVVGSVPLEMVILPGLHLFVIIKGGKRFAKRDWDVKPGLAKVWEVTEPKPPPRPPRKIFVRPPPPTPPPPPPKPEPRGISMWYTLSTGALALVAVGAAVGTGMRAKSLHDEYYEQPTRATRDEGRTMVNATNALWGVAGALGVASVVLAIFTQWKTPKEKEKATSLPMLNFGVEQGGASVTITGRF